MIKVDKNVKSIHYSKRVTCDLVIGKKYYYSEGNNIAKECTLVAIYSEMNKVAIKPKNGLQKIRFTDEIGETPEQAIINTMTS